MTLNTVSPQELEIMNYIEQHIRDNYTIQLAINHHLIKLDYVLSPNNIFLYLNIYLNDTTGYLLSKINFPIKLAPDTLPFKSATELKGRANKKLQHLVKLSDSLLNL